MAVKNPLKAKTSSGQAVNLTDITFGDSISIRYYRQNKDMSERFIHTAGTMFQEFLQKAIPWGPGDRH